MSKSPIPIDRMIGNLVLARYRIVRVLAHGGMGILYLGRTEGAAGFSRPVVVKRILPHLIANPRMAGLFVREARILSELHHPGIVSILDFGEEDGAYLMVLEFVRGYDLGLWHHYLRDTGGLMNGDVAIHIMTRVLDALHYAHTFVRPDGRRLNIVHRDVSPGNVLIDTDGQVKLLDFGIARFQDDAGEYRTRSGEFKGKAAYTPPEIFRGQEATAQTDIFSAGVVLYKILAGFNPFEGDNAAQTMKRITDFDPEPITRVRADLKRDMNAVLARALAKNPEHRFQTAAEFSEALRACRSQPEEKVSARFLTDIQRDFLGAMPAHLGLEPLPVLDAAWRAPSTSELRAIGEASMTRAEPTEGEPTRAWRSPEKPPMARTLRRTSLAALIVVAVALAVVLGSQLRLGDTHIPPPVVVVQRPENAPPTSPSPTDLAPVPTPSADPQVAIQKEETPTTGRAARPPRERPRLSVGEPDANALTRSFRRHQLAIERCFEEAIANSDHTAEVAVQFQIEKSGKVKSVETIPAGIADTPLGSCLLKVARGTAFGPQAAPLAFRIPLRARQFRDR